MLAVSNRVCLGYNINDRNWRTSCQEAGVTAGLVTAGVFSLRLVFGKDSEAVEQ